MDDIGERIERLIRRVEVDPQSIGMLSVGERLAVALVLDRKDLLGDFTMLEAVERLGEWYAPAREVQRRLRDSDLMRR